MDSAEKGLQASDALCLSLLLWRMGTGRLLHIGAERTEGSSPSLSMAGPALPPLQSEGRPLSQAQKSQQEPSRACVLDLGLLCHLLLPGPSPRQFLGSCRKWVRSLRLPALTSHHGAGLCPCAEYSRGEGHMTCTPHSGAPFGKP